SFIKSAKSARGSVVVAGSWAGGGRRTGGKGASDDIRGRDPGPVGRPVRAGPRRSGAGAPVLAGYGGGHAGGPRPPRYPPGPARGRALGRSEERRVGKECR